MEWTAIEAGCVYLETKHHLNNNSFVVECVAITSLVPSIVFYEPLKFFSIVHAINESKRALISNGLVLNIYFLNSFNF